MPKFRSQLKLVYNLCECVQNECNKYGKKRKKKEKLKPVKEICNI